MTKNQVLALCTTPAQRERAEAIYEAAARFGKKAPFDTMKSNNEVVRYIDNAVEIYKKRKEQQKKNEIKKAEQKAKIDELMRTYKQALAQGAMHIEVIETIKGIYKNKHNARIQAQIDALKSQLL